MGHANLCRGPELNWRHMVLQTIALPTELPRREPHFTRKLELAGARIEYLSEQWSRPLCCATAATVYAVKHDRPETIALNRRRGHARQLLSLHHVTPPEPTEMPLVPRRGDQTRPGPSGSICGLSVQRPRTVLNPHGCSTHAFFLSLRSSSANCGEYSAYASSQARSLKDQPGSAPTQRMEPSAEAPCSMRRCTR